MKNGEIMLYLIKNEEERFRQMIRDYKIYFETQRYQTYQINQTFYQY
jgi:hypothetical protein